MPPGLAADEGPEAFSDIDWSSWALTEEDIMPGSLEQDSIIRLFAAYLTAWAKEKGWRGIVACDVFFAWDRRRQNVRVAPDGFVCDDRDLPRRGVVNTWKPGRLPPRFALEVVSKDRRKDYKTGPVRYAALGTHELAVFDPAAAESRPSLYRSPLTFYRRVDGQSMRLVYEGRGPVFSEELGAWLVTAEVEGAPHLRIARDKEGKDLVLTEADAERARADQAQALALKEKALADQEKSRADQEKSRADQAQALAAQEKSRADLAERRLRELVQASRSS